MEKNIIIVDEKDRVIGVRPRDLVDKEGLRYRVSALWLTDSKGRILLAKRALTKSHSPGKWSSAVAGTVEEGESYEENIKKEIMEELGITLKKFKKGPKLKIDGEHKFFTQWFVGVVDRNIKDFRIQKEEVAEIRWFLRDELEKLLISRSEEFIGGLMEFLKLFS